MVTGELGKALTARQACYEKQIPGALGDVAATIPRLSMLGHASSC